jgi:hypothetical protein
MQGKIVLAKLYYCALLLKTFSAIQHDFEQIGQAFDLSSNLHVCMGYHFQCDRCNSELWWALGLSIYSWLCGSGILCKMGPITQAVLDSYLPQIFSPVVSTYSRLGTLERNLSRGLLCYTQAHYFLALSLA